MSQQEIINYIKKNKERQDITIKELVMEFNKTQGTIQRAVKKMEKHHEIRVIYDGRRKLIGIIKEE